jgi:hypothetical protein
LQDVLLTGERFGLVEDTVGDVELAYVVEKSRSHLVAHRRSRKPHVPGYLHDRRRDTLGGPTDKRCPGVDDLGEGVGGKVQTLGGCYESAWFPSCFFKPIDPTPLAVWPTG